MRRQQMALVELRVWMISVHSVACNASAQSEILVSGPP